MSSQYKNVQLQQAVRSVLGILHRKGLYPELHDEIMAKHRQEWPALWSALDRLNVAYEAQRKTETPDSA